MDLDNKFFIKVSKKKKITELHARYFNKYKNENVCDKKVIINKIDRMNNCLNYWLWDEYKLNKVLDLKSVNRCKDLFCPNCRLINVSKALVKLNDSFIELLNDDYVPYMMTLTIPNVKGDNLKDTLNKLSKSFFKFWCWINRVDNSKSFGRRLFRAEACVKVLEITVQKNNNSMFHPHYHCLVFLKLDSKSDDFIFDKVFDGGYRQISKDYTFYSYADLFIQKLWKMAYEGINIKNFDKISSKWFDNYICDIREIDFESGGLFEVFKYCFKDSDIKNYGIFKVFYESLKNKRIRQGYGKLFNNVDIVIDEDDNETIENIINYLKIDELPEVLRVNGIDKHNKEFGDYKKVSRFKSYSNIRDIKDY